MGWDFGVSIWGFCDLMAGFWSLAETFSGRVSNRLGFDQGDMVGYEVRLMWKGVLMGSATMGKGLEWYGSWFGIVGVMIIGYLDDCWVCRMLSR